jgi:hypothetical protein
MPRPNQTAGRLRPCDPPLYGRSQPTTR